MSSATPPTPTPTPTPASLPRSTEPAPGLRVIVTGAAGGIGRAIVAHLAARGCRLGLCDLVPLESDEVENGERERDGGHVVATRQFDLADPEAVRTGVNALVEALGGCDAVVGNAGIVDTLHRAERFPDAAWDRDLAANLSGQFALVRAAFPALAESGDGRIVLVSSTAAETGLPGQAAYSASKAGVVGLVRTLAAEWAPRGIRCNVVMPGMVDTPKVRGLPPQARERMAEVIPLGFFGEPAELAGTIAFLLSPAAAYITGATIRVDGGWGLNVRSLAR